MLAANWYSVSLIAGSIASSAPIQAQVDFQQYYDVVASSLATTGPNCNENVALATKMLATLTETSAGLANLSKAFK